MLKFEDVFISREKQKWLLEEINATYDPKNASWEVAVLLSVLGSIFIALGLVAQKHFFIVEHLVSDCRAKIYWYIGIVLVVLVAAPFDMGAMAFGSLDLVVPFAGVTIAASVILSWMLLHESVSCFHLCATMFTSAGVAITAAFGPKNTRYYTAMEFEDLMLSGDFVAHSSLSLTIFTLFAVLGFHVAPPVGKLWGFAFAMMAAIAGAHTYILLKALADFLYLSVHGDDQFKNGWMYAVLVVLLLFSTVQMFCLNKGLERIDASWFLPIYQALLTSTWMVVSCLMFDEFDTMDSSQLLLFVTGINMTIWGIVALAKRSTIIGNHDSPAEFVLKAYEEYEKEGMLAIQTEEDFEDSAKCPEVDRWV